MNSRRKHVGCAWLWHNSDSNLPTSAETAEGPCASINSLLKGSRGFLQWQEKVKDCNYLIKRYGPAINSLHLCRAVLLNHTVL